VQGFKICHPERSDWPRSGQSWSRRTPIAKNADGELENSAHAIEIRESCRGPSTAQELRCSRSSRFAQDDKWLGLFRAQLFKEHADRFNPAIEIRNMKLLVRRMEVVIRQPESHHDTGGF
jgi:hypothetical protein